MTYRDTDYKRELQTINVQRPSVRPRRRRRRKKHTFRKFLLCFLSVICLVLLALDNFQSQPEDIPAEFTELLKLNEETYDFVKEYPNRAAYLGQAIDLSSDSEVTDALASGEVPLLIQWDLRWGYAPYGDDIVGLSGCGPACLSMAYIYLTGDTSMHPAAMAEFAYEHGFYSDSGTKWSLWTDGVSRLGLTGSMISLDESAMKNTLDGGGIIICSMRPGDFTTTGHFILIRGYDENGFYVNDPNRRSNSGRQWKYEELSPQIKNLWGIWQSTSPA